MGWDQAGDLGKSSPAFHMLLQSITKFSAEVSTDVALSRQEEGAGAFVPGRISAPKSSVKSWVANTKENPERKGTS